MEKIYYNGTILTMDQPFQVEAVLTRNGKITAVGRTADLKKTASPSVELVDLHGQTMLPAFIDPHSHITALGQTLSLVNLEGTTSYQEIVKQMKNFIHVKHPTPGEWVMGFNYDHNDLKEKKHPTRALLDEISTEFPVMLTHVSGHMGVFNTLALKELGIDKNTPCPEGGKIGHDAAGEPNGYLEEAAFIQASPKIPRISLEQLCENTNKAQDIYLSYGITTVQDGLTKAGEMKILTTMAEKNMLKVDVVSYVDLKNSHQLMAENHPYTDGYRNRFRIGGYKIFLDGSPQAMTAWMTKPYLNKGDYCGYPVYQNDEVKEFVQTSLSENRQLLTHCNGDAAAQQYIDACRSCNNIAKIRPVMIHAQTLRPDQVPELKPLGIIPSYFVAHTYQWGDIHIKNLGMERAKEISPAKTTEECGIPFTFHQDSPVLPPDMLMTIWCAVNRITKAGQNIGQEQRISVEAALKAVTINAAYQYFEEDSKGSITPGKLSNFVLLERNPLEVPPLELNKINVMQTIREDEVLYSK